MTSLRNFIFLKSSLNGLGYNGVNEVMHDAHRFLQFVFPELCKRPMHAKAHAVKAVTKREEGWSSEGEEVFPVVTVTVTY